MLELYRKKWREKLYIDTSKLAIKALIELRKIDYQKWQPISCPLLEVIKRARGFGAMPRTIPAAENKSTPAVKLGSI